jgi:hypothetical protein
MFEAGRFALTTLITLGLLLAGLPAAAFDKPAPDERIEATPPYRLVEGPPADAPYPIPNYVMAARDTLEVEEHGGYTSEYIFGMSKAIMRSTLTPALKPAVLLLTVPLDLVLLPFAALGGFFR